MDKVLHKEHRTHSDIRTGRRMSTPPPPTQGPLLSHTSWGGYPALSEQGEGASEQEERAAGAESPAKDQRWGWDLGNLPGLLHLLNKLIKHLSSTCPLAGFVAGTEVSGEKTHLSCPPDRSRDTSC